MPKIQETRIVAASLEQVFSIVANPEQYAGAIEGVASIEVLSETQSGLGARFRQTRLINGKELLVEIEITEYAENSRVRLKSESSGCQWDTDFSLGSAEWPAQLTITMDASAYRLQPTPVNLHVMGLVGGAVAKDADAVKAFCEKKS